MSDLLTLWSRMFLRLGLVLLGLGVIPLLLVQYVFTDFNPLIPLLLSLSVAPIGVLVLLIALILFLAGLLRRRPESSAPARGPSPPDQPPR